MDVKYNEEQSRLHTQLLTEINDQLDSNSEENAAFRLQITKPLGGAGVLGRCGNLFDMFKQLSKRNKLGVLNYDVLKDAFKGSNNNDIVELIKEREQEIRKAANVPRNEPSGSKTTKERKAVESSGSKTTKERKAVESSGSKTTKKRKAVESRRSKTTYRITPEESIVSKTTHRKNPAESSRSKTTFQITPEVSIVSKTTYRKKPEESTGSKATCTITPEECSGSETRYKRKAVESSGSKTTYRITPEESSGSIKKKKKKGEKSLDARKDKAARPETEDKIKEYLEYYNTARKTGFLLILHFYEDRQGLDGDIDRLTGFFEDTLHFDVVIVPRASNSQEKGELRDLTSGQVTAALVSVRNYLNKEENARRYYCFMCVVLSHGDKGVIKTKDGFYNVDSIRKIFNNKEMKQFAAKPKIFVIQACQGDEDQDYLMVDDESDTEEDNTVREDKQPIEESDALVSIPKDADVLFAFATTPDLSVPSGNILTDRGTYLIIRLVEIFQRWYTKLHLEDMMISVRIKTLKPDCLIEQTMKPYTWSTLTKRLKFKVGKRNWTSRSTQRDRQLFPYGDESVLIDSVLNS